MQKLYIPQLKDVLELAANWEFLLYEEPRNLSLIQLVDIDYKGGGWPDYDHNLSRFPKRKTWGAMLPAGTKLTVDRIYIRAGGEDFSSLTFRTVYKGKKVRFWVKLVDANTIVLAKEIK